MCAKHFGFCFCFMNRAFCNDSVIESCGFSGYIVALSQDNVVICDFYHNFLYHSIITNLLSFYYIPLAMSIVKLYKYVLIRKFI